MKTNTQSSVDHHNCCVVSWWYLDSAQSVSDVLWLRRLQRYGQGALSLVQPAQHRAHVLLQLCGCRTCLCRPAGGTAQKEERRLRYALETGMLFGGASWWLSWISPTIGNHNSLPIFIYPVFFHCECPYIDESQGPNYGKLPLRQLDWISVNCSSHGRWTGPSQCPRTLRCSLIKNRIKSPRGRRSESAGPCTCLVELNNPGSIKIPTGQSDFSEWDVCRMNIPQLCHMEINQPWTVIKWWISLHRWKGEMLSGLWQDS